MIVNVSFNLEKIENLEILTHLTIGENYNFIQILKSPQ